MDGTGAMHMVNSFDPASGVTLEPRAAALIERRRRVLGAPYRLFYERPVEVGDGDGVLLFDPDGLDYLDAFGAAIHAAFLMAAGIMAVAFVLSWLLKEAPLKTATH